MKTGPITEDKEMKQGVYNIPCECGRCYIGKTSRPFDVYIKENNYNLSQGLPEISESVQYAYEDHKTHWKEAKVLKLNRRAHIRNVRTQPTL
jgi:hypothetical protein